MSVTVHSQPAGTTRGDIANQMGVAPRLVAVVYRPHHVKFLVENANPRHRYLFFPVGQWSDNDWASAMDYFGRVKDRDIVSCHELEGEERENPHVHVFRTENTQ